MIGSECPEDTAPGHQQLTEIAYYNVQTGCPPGTYPGNSRVGWSYIDPLTGKIVVAIGNFAKAITTYPTDWQVIEFADSDTCEGFPAIGPPPTGGDSLPFMGKSDEHSYVVKASDTVGRWGTYFDWDDQTATEFEIEPPSWVGFAVMTRWAKRGNLLWAYIDNGVFGSAHALGEISLGTGLQTGRELIDPFGAGTAPNVYDMQATADYLYILRQVISPPAGTSNRAITKIDLTTFTIVDTFLFDYDTANALNGFAAVGMYVVSDDLIYIIRHIHADSSVEIGYYDTVNEVYMFVDRIATSTLHATVASQFWFHNGLFYVGGLGGAGSSVNISVIGPVACPTPDNLAGGVLISFSDFETPDPLPKLAVSYAQLRVPDPYPQLAVSYASLQVPDPGSSIEPCPNTATRYPTPAYDDYILDCYDTGSYS